MALESDAAKFVSNFEGLAKKAMRDVDAWRGGHGSDTKTFPDGTFRKVVEGDTFTMEEADRDLARRIKADFFPIVQGQIGMPAWNGLSDNAKIALISFAYNYGRITKNKIVEAAKTLDHALLAATIVTTTLNDNMKLEEKTGMSKEKADKIRAALKKRRQKEADLVVKDAPASQNHSTDRTIEISQTTFPTTTPSSGGDFNFSFGRFGNWIMKLLTILIALYCTLKLFSK